MTAIKICGLRDRDTATACLRSGVDWVGLNFVARSRRVIDLPTAATLLEIVPPARAIAVVEDASFEAITEILAALPGLAGVQLHGHEAPDLAARLLSRGLTVIKAIPVGPSSFDPAVLLPYAGCVSAFLFDAPRAGSGTSFEWSALAAGPRSVPLFLAGGLRPENVARAIVEAHPDAVDTASGIEGPDGRPDPARVLAFVEAVRRADEDRRRTE